LAGPWTPQRRNAAEGLADDASTAVDLLRMNRCPACSALLYRRVIGGMKVDGCPTCAGVWLDKGELHQLARDPALLRTLERTFLPGPQASKPEQTGACPRCERALTPFEYDAFRGVRLDQCKGCGGLFMGNGKAGEIAGRLEQRVPGQAPGTAPAAAGAIDLPPVSRASGAGAAVSPALAARFGGVPTPARTEAAHPAPAGVVPAATALVRDVRTPSVVGGVLFWETLRSTDFVLLHQQLELGELFGFETRNKYALRAEAGQFGWAAEQSKSVLGFLLRQLLGHWRPFEIHVFDGARQPVLRAIHPFRVLFQRLEVQRADGSPIGAVQQRFSIFSKRFDVEDATGRVLMTVSSPIWRIWTFPFLRGGQQVGAIEKKWSGFLSEAFTDKDRFLVRFTQELSEEERALLLVAGIFVDLVYFEAKSS
jgi:Zn-finger nucleic acid-binding protein/uncharacterized protein YxjI